MTHATKEITRLLNGLYCPTRASLHDTTGWHHRHRNAVACPRLGFERAMVEMLRGWLRYADTHRDRYESGIGDDGVLGPMWAHIGDGLLGLLNGELGNLDAGTMDGLIRDALLSQGIDPDTM